MRAQPCGFQHNGGAAVPVMLNGRSLPTTVRQFLNVSKPALPLPVQHLGPMLLDGFGKTFVD
jgi:hypothetical protein